VATNLFGQFHVTPTFTAMKEAEKMFPKYGEYQEIRRQALKLAFWPAGDSQGGKICDLDWEEIVGMQAPKACELRIDDRIGGFDNLRVIFYVFRKDLILPDDVKPRLWTLSVIQKKTRRWSNNDLKMFRARVVILRRRTYGQYL
jgi:hypothetical protein